MSEELFESNFPKLREILSSLSEEEQDKILKMSPDEFEKLYERVNSLPAAQSLQIISFLFVLFLDIGPFVLIDELLDNYTKKINLAIFLARVFYFGEYIENKQFLW